MKRPLSQLIHARIQEGEGTPRIITVHAHNQYGPDAGHLGVAASPSGRVIALESYKGVYVGRTIVGYTWFVGPLDAPAPVFFGDALAEIERFLWDEVDRQERNPAELPFLVGVEQGAIMALAAAAAVPDLLSGVIAIDATFPRVPGWDPPLMPLDGLPILLIDRKDDTGVAGKVLSGSSLAATLATWGATVDRRVDESPVPETAMREFMHRNPVRMRGLAG